MFLIIQRLDGRDWFLGGFTVEEGELPNILPIWESARHSGVRFPWRDGAEQTIAAFKITDATIEPF